AGHETIGHEISLDLAERGRATIDHYLTRALEKGRLAQADKDAAVARLTLTTELADLADCDLVIEAVLEELPLKREVFAELDRVTRPEAILATNTSALSVAEIAEATERPERVVGMHFFNPAPVLPLVDLVGIDVHIHASEALSDKLGEERMAPPERLLQLQRERRLGRKTGRGFFDY